MFSSPWFWIVLCALPLGGALAAYNRLVKYRNRIREAWSGIDVQLKRRHDLIPELVKTVQAYARHESVVLENVVQIRAESLRAGTTADAEATEQRLSESLRPLLALAEAYPDLKANRNFLQLQQNLIETEDMLQMARRYYNGSVRDFNNRVEMFPSNLVARLFGFQPREFFEIETATEREAPSLDLATGG